jgi:cell division protein ZapA (FtsZ GTPase activity inhibitor)
MSQKNDQVFNLSITEIWMVLAFILLLLSGWQVWKLTNDNKALAQKLVDFDSFNEQEKAIKEASQELKTRLAEMGLKNPDEVISKLVEASKARDEVGQLKVLLTQKDDQLTALAAIDKALQELGSKDKEKDAKRLILETLMSFDQLKKLVADQDEETQLTDIVKRIGVMKATEQMLKTALKTNDELTADQVQKIVKDAGAYADADKAGLDPTSLQKVNSDLKGQVQFLQNRLNRGKGGDLPPCWADPNTGKPEMFLAVFLKENNLNFEPAWPTSRLADAQALPGFTDLMANTSRSYENFMRATRAINAFGNQNGCKYYVRIKSQIQDAPTSDKRRIQVEGNFYKVEVKRW